MQRRDPHTESKTDAQYLKKKKHLKYGCASGKGKEIDLQNKKKV